MSALLVAACGARTAGAPPPPDPIDGPISQYELPDAWERYIRSRYLSDVRIAAARGETARAPDPDGLQRLLPDPAPFGATVPAPVPSDELPGGGPRVEEAEQAVDRGELDRALDLAGRALADDPGDLQALFVMAWAQGDQGQAAASLLSWQRLLDAEPGAAEAWLGLGTVLVDMGRPDEAIAPLDRALAVDPTWEIWLQRGIALCRAGRFDEAEWDLWQAARLEPGDPNAWYDLAWVYAQRRDAGAAVEVLRFAARHPGLFAVRHCREVLAGEPVFHPLVGDATYEAYLDRLPARCIAQERRNVLLGGASGR